MPEMKLRTHSPNDLLLEEAPEPRKFQPGHIVSHVLDEQAFGMVIGRRENEGKVECDVMWSKPPEHLGGPGMLIPTSATWTRTVRHDVRRFDDAYSNKSFYGPGCINETFDGDEVYAPGTISSTSVWRLATRRGSKVNVSFYGDGRTEVSYRDVAKWELPAYVLRNLPDNAARYDHGRNQ